MGAVNNSNLSTQQKELFDDSELRRIFPVNGFLLKQFSVNLVRNKIEFGFDCERGVEKQIIHLYIPQPCRYTHDVPVFDIEGTEKVVVYAAQPGCRYNETHSVLDMRVLSPKEMILVSIQRALSRGLANGTPSETAQRSLDNFFSNSEFIRIVDTNKPVDEEVSATTVVLDFPKSTKWQEYALKNWEGVLDMISGTQGDKIGHVYRLARDCTIVNNKFVPGKSLLSKVMRRYTVFPENTRPNRLLITRPVFGRAEKLLYEEQPLVAHHSYDGDLHGIHLRTAIQTHPENYQDAIVISQQAAEKLCCEVKKRITIQDTAPIVMLINEGDEITAYQQVAKLIYENEENVQSIHNPHCGAYKWIVDKIERSEVLISGHPGIRYRIHLSTTYMMHNGCKLTTRHGGKGVVKIMKNTEMPSINGEPIDVLVHPLTFNSRRHFGTMREAMVNRKHWQEYIKDPMRVLIRTEHFQDENSMEQLVSEGWAGTTSIRLPIGMDTDAFVAPVYWLRADKHAADQVSVRNNSKPTNQKGLNPDSGKSSGKRMGLGYTTILHAQGLKPLADHLISNNIEHSAIDFVDRVLACIE